MYGLDDICDLKKDLLSWAKEHKDCGVDTIPMYGQVIDMIKDLYEAEEKCYEAWYYAMAAREIGEESKDDEMREMGRYGYDNYRYKSSGRFAPKGHGTRMGYPHMNGKMPIEMRDDMLGYPDRDWDRDRHMRTGRYGYPMDETKSESYNNWDDARRHYHEYKDPASRMEMDQHAMKHAHEVVKTSKEMYDEASPEIKKKLKEEFSHMVSDMS